MSGAGCGRAAWGPCPLGSEAPCSDAFLGFADWITRLFTKPSRLGSALPGHVLPFSARHSTGSVPHALVPPLPPQAGWPGQSSSAHCGGAAARSCPLCRRPPRPRLPPLSQTEAALQKARVLGTWPRGRAQTHPGFPRGVDFAIRPRPSGDNQRPGCEGTGWAHLKSRYLNAWVIFFPVTRLEDKC